MAITTLATAEAELQARGYGRFSTTRLDAWLNSAKNRFEDYQFDWPWLKTSTSGAAPLTIADLRRVQTVVDVASKQPIGPLPADAVVALGGGDLTLSGFPAGWYLVSDTVLSTYPVASGSVSVRYVKFSPELASGSDVPLIPARYRVTWVDLAEVEALRFGAKDQAAATALEQGVFRRLGEIAGVYAMQAQSEYAEMLMTGASIDG